MKKLLSTFVLGTALSGAAMAAGSNMYVAADAGDYSYGGRSTTGLAFSGGMKVAPNLAAEVGLVMPNSYSYGGGFIFDHSVLKGAAVAFMPINPRIDLFGKVGLARVAWSDNPGSSGSDINLMFGFGAQMPINPQLSVRAQYEYYGSNVVGWSNGYYRGSTNMLSVGALFNF